MEQSWSFEHAPTGSGDRLVSGATGALLDAPFPIAASPQNEVLPAAASHAPASFLILDQRTDPAATSLAERIPRESSDVVTVSLTITPVNDPPIGVPVTLQTDEDTPVDLRPLVGVDPEGEAITSSVYTLPEHGTLTGTPWNLRYTPAPNYHGTDSFTFIVTDASGLASDPILVSITVRPLNDVPVALAQSASLDARGLLHVDDRGPPQGTLPRAHPGDG